MGQGTCPCLWQEEESPSHMLHCGVMNLPRECVTLLTKKPGEAKRKAECSEARDALELLALPTMLCPSSGKSLPQSAIRLNSDPHS